MKDSSSVKNIYNNFYTVDNNTTVSRIIVTYS